MRQGVENTLVPFYSQKQRILLVILDSLRQIVLNQLDDTEGRINTMPVL